MTRRRFYAPQISFAAGGKSVTLSAEETRHARDVLRLEPGDEVFVFDGAGNEFRCAVAEFTGRSMIADVIEKTDPLRSESPLDLSLGVALLKGEKFDLVVQKATELGVTRLVPLMTTRADVRVREPEDARRKVERWTRIAIESAKQCGRARLMRVDPPFSFDDWLGSIADVQLKVMFAARDGGSFAGAFETEFKPGCMVAAVGSEGGWSDEEIAQARKSGWKIVTLGGRILRAETAAITVAALLQYRFGDLS